MIDTAVDVVSVVCVVGMATAVFSSFSSVGSERQFRERRSFVATCSMALFAVVFYMTIQSRLGMIPVRVPWNVLPFRLVGSLVMLGSLAFNWWGRVHLKSNWSDHVRIYDDHSIITTGPFRIVRHPLYASTIWMFLAAALAYWNWLSALETLVVFLPAMTYRAHLEERALESAFGEAYAAYRTGTPRFFPHFRGVHKKTEATWK